MATVWDTFTEPKKPQQGTTVWDNITPTPEAPKKPEEAAIRAGRQERRVVDPTQVRAAEVMKMGPLKYWASRFGSGFERNLIYGPAQSSMQLIHDYARGETDLPWIRMEKGTGRMVLGGTAQDGPPMRVPFDPPAGIQIPSAARKHLYQTLMPDRAKESMSEAINMLGDPNYQMFTSVAEPERQFRSAMAAERGGKDLVWNEFLESTVDLTAYLASMMIARKAMGKIGGPKFGRAGLGMKRRLVSGVIPPDQLADSTSRLKTLGMVLRNPETYNNLAQIGALRYIMTPGDKRDRFKAASWAALYNATPYFANSAAVGLPVQAGKNILAPVIDAGLNMAISTPTYTAMVKKHGGFEQAVQNPEFWSEFTPMFFADIWFARNTKGWKGANAETLRAGAFTRSAHKQTMTREEWEGYIDGLQVLPGEVVTKKGEPELVYLGTDPKTGQKRLINYSRESEDVLDAFLFDVRKDKVKEPEFIKTTIKMAPEDEGKLAARANTTVERVRKAKKVMGKVFIEGGDKKRPIKFEELPLIVQDKLIAAMNEKPKASDEEYRQMFTAMLEAERFNKYYITGPPDSKDAVIWDLGQNVSLEAAASSWGHYTTEGRTKIQILDGTTGVKNQHTDDATQFSRRFVQGGANERSTADLAMQLGATRKHLDRLGKAYSMANKEEREHAEKKILNELYRIRFGVDAYPKAQQKSHANWNTEWLMTTLFPLVDFKKDLDRVKIIQNADTWGVPDNKDGKIKFYRDDKIPGAKATKSGDKYWITYSPKHIDKLWELYNKGERYMPKDADKEGMIPIPQGLSRDEFRMFAIQHERLHLLIGIGEGVGDENMLNAVALREIGRPELAQELMYGAMRSEYQKASIGVAVKQLKGMQGQIVGETEKKKPTRTFVDVLKDARAHRPGSGLEAEISELRQSEKQVRRTLRQEGPREQDEAAAQRDEAEINLRGKAKQLGVSEDKVIELVDSAKQTQTERETTMSMDKPKPEEVMLRMQHEWSKDEFASILEAVDTPTSPLPRSDDSKMIEAMTTIKAMVDGAGNSKKSGLFYSIMGKAQGKSAALVLAELKDALFVSEKVIPKPQPARMPLKDRIQQAKIKPEDKEYADPSLIKSAGPKPAIYAVEEAEKGVGIKPRDLKKGTVIISGGQTGADRGGLEGAKALGIKTGGTAPKGWRTEKGADLSLKDFGLKEHLSSEYVPRTRQNVQDSDVTVWFGNTGSPGFMATRYAANRFGKKFIVNPTADQLREYAGSTINIAGNRGSKNEGLAERVSKTIQEAFGRPAREPSKAELELQAERREARKKMPGTTVTREFGLGWVTAYADWDEPQFARPRGKFETGWTYKGPYKDPGEKIKGKYKWTDIRVAEELRGKVLPDVPVTLPKGGVAGPEGETYERLQAREIAMLKQHEEVLKPQPDVSEIKNRVLATPYKYDKEAYELDRRKAEIKSHQELFGDDKPTVYQAAWAEEDRPSEKRAAVTEEDKELLLKKGISEEELYGEEGPSFILDSTVREAMRAQHEVKVAKGIVNYYEDMINRQAAAKKDFAKIQDEEIRKKLIEQVNKEMEDAKRFMKENKETLNELYAQYPVEKSVAQIKTRAFKNLEKLDNIDRAKEDFSSGLFGNWKVHARKYRGPSDLAIKVSQLADRMASLFKVNFMDENNSVWSHIWEKLGPHRYKQFQDYKERQKSASLPMQDRATLYYKAHQMTNEKGYNIYLGEIHKDVIEGFQRKYLERVNGKIGSETYSYNDFWKDKEKLDFVMKGALEELFMNRDDVIDGTGKVGWSLIGQGTHAIMDKYIKGVNTNQGVGLSKGFLDGFSGKSDGGQEGREFSYPELYRFFTGKVDIDKAYLKKNGRPIGAFFRLLPDELKDTEVWMKQEQEMYRWKLQDSGDTLAKSTNMDRRAINGYTHYASVLEAPQDIKKGRAGVLDPLQDFELSRESGDWSDFVYRTKGRGLRPILRVGVSEGKYIKDVMDRIEYNAFGKFIESMGHPDNKYIPVVAYAGKKYWSGKVDDKTGRNIDITLDEAELKNMGYVKMNEAPLFVHWKSGDQFMAPFVHKSVYDILVDLYGGRQTNKAMQLALKTKGMRKRWIMYTPMLMGIQGSSSAWLYAPPMTIRGMRIPVVSSTLGTARAMWNQGIIPLVTLEMFRGGARARGIIGERKDVAYNRFLGQNAKDIELAFRSGLRVMRTNDLYNQLWNSDVKEPMMRADFDNFVESTIGSRFGLDRWVFENYMFRNIFESWKFFKEELQKPKRGIFGMQKGPLARMTGAREAMDEVTASRMASHFMNTVSGLVNRFMYGSEANALQLMFFARDFTMSTFQQLTGVLPATWHYRNLPGSAWATQGKLAPVKGWLARMMNPLWHKGMSIEEIQGLKYHFMEQIAKVTAWKMLTVNAMQLGFGKGWAMNNPPHKKTLVHFTDDKITGKPIYLDTLIFRELNTYLALLANVPGVSPLARYGFLKMMKYKMEGMLTDMMFIFANKNPDMPGQDLTYFEFKKPLGRMQQWVRQRTTPYLEQQVSPEPLRLAMRGQTEMYRYMLAQATLPVKILTGQKIDPHVSMADREIARELKNIMRQESANKSRMMRRLKKAIPDPNSPVLQRLIGDGTLTKADYLNWYTDEIQRYWKDYPQNIKREMLLRMRSPERRKAAWELDMRYFLPEIDRLYKESEKQLGR